MCKPGLDIHFCTCASITKKPLFVKGSEEVDKAKYEKTQLIWKLYRYIGEKDSGIMGEMIMPVDQLDQDLTIAFLITQLNRKNIFDFDYSPVEGDNLEIRNEYIYKKIKGQPRPDLYSYMSFIFRNGAWTDDFYDVFNDKTKGIKKGKIKFVAQEETLKP